MDILVVYSTITGVYVVKSRFLFSLPPIVQGSFSPLSRSSQKKKWIIERPMSDSEYSCFKAFLTIVPAELLAEKLCS